MSTLNRPETTSPIDPSTLRRLRRSLVDERHSQIGFAVDFSEYGADITADMDDRSTAIALAARSRQAIEEIDLALTRIDNGCYGRCQDCGRTMPADRLEAIPYVRCCRECQIQHRSGAVGSPPPRKDAPAMARA